MQNSPPRELAFHQLCAIARMALVKTPTSDDSEWRESIKLAVRKQGYGYPTPEQLTRAMDHVDRAMQRTMGPRLPPPPGPLVLPSGPPQQHDPPWRGVPRTGSWASMKDMARVITGMNLSSSVDSDRPADAPPEARDVLDVDEHALLRAFWRDYEADHGRRLEILAAYAEIALLRPPEWDYDGIREAAWRHTFTAHGCTACGTGDRPLAWHHVIQVQHGGSNVPANRIALCEACHAAIHPWMPPVARLAPNGWTSLEQLAEARPVGRPGDDRKAEPMMTWAFWNGRWPTSCGYSDEHVIREGEIYLRIEVVQGVIRRRCTSCAMTTFGLRDPYEPERPPIPVVDEDEPRADVVDDVPISLDEARHRRPLPRETTEALEHQLFDQPWEDA